MNQTMAERRQDFEKKVTGLYAKVEKMQQALDEATARVVQILLLELAAADPSITEFSFDANYEYDDEGSYYWSASFSSDGDHGPGGDSIEYDPWERFEAVEQYASEKATALAFNSSSNLEGQITVNELQEAVGW